MFFFDDQFRVALAKALKASWQRCRAMSRDSSNA